MIESVVVTCSAPVNIAVIKYWGKRNEELNLPLNSSLSGTLHQNDLKTVTTVMASKAFKDDEIWLNGKKEDIRNKRLQNCLLEIRRRATEYKDAEGNVLISREDWPQYKVHIVSTNNFPTAAGLASSASGFCCLVFALSKIYNVVGDISAIARVGSGSACRSLFGGWVAWEKGVEEDGSDSIAVPIASETHWREMQVLVLVVNDNRKDTSSTLGMQRSVETSRLLKERAEHIVPDRMLQMIDAIGRRDFSLFSELTMMDSDDFHRVCADTDPPIFYLNEISKKIIKIIRALNEFSTEPQAAYTFDAGPNAVIYLPQRSMVSVMALVLHYFPPSATAMKSFVKDEGLLQRAKAFPIAEPLKKLIHLEPQPDSLKYILSTSIGPGPQVLSETLSLIDISTGLPYPQSRM